MQIPQRLGIEAKDACVLINPADQKALTLILTDLAGRELLIKKVEQFSEKIILETGQIPSGTYFVQTWQQGKMVATGMFLKI
jgi:hypothetical protein